MIDPNQAIIDRNAPDLMANEVFQNRNNPNYDPNWRNNPQPQVTPTNGTPTTGTQYTPLPVGDVYGNAGANTAQSNLDLYNTDPNAYMAGKGITTQAEKNKALAEMQAQIDATNAMYANQLSQAKVQGQGALGSSTAIQARRGLLGSDFGGALTSGVEQANTNIYNSIEAERNAKIQDLMSQAQTKAEQRYKDQRDLASSSLQGAVDVAKAKQTQIKTGATEAAQQLLVNGLDPSHMTEEQLAKYAKDNATNITALKNAFQISSYTTKKADEEAKKKLADAANIETVKYTRDQANLDRKFAEDKRQFGMEYALKQQDLAQKRASDGLLSVAEANAAGVPYGTTKSALINKPVTTVDTQKSLDQIALAKKSLKNATDLADASGDTSWFTGAARALSGARPIDNLTAETNTLRTNVLTMATDPTIKKFFGPQMSNADVQLMTSAGTTLNPELQSPKQMKEELLRLSDFIDRAEKAVKQGQGNSGTISVTDPNGGVHSFPDQASADAFKKSAGIK